MKTLTALVMTGVLTLGACGPDVYRSTDGTVRYRAHSRQNGEWYAVDVTDNNRQAFAGAHERIVEMEGYGAEGLKATPFQVQGAASVPVSGEAKPLQFGRGLVRYSSATPSGESAGCVWGVDPATVADYKQCSAQEIKAASAMLNTAVEDVFN